MQEMKSSGKYKDIEYIDYAFDFAIGMIEDGLSSIYSPDYEPGYAPHICTENHSGNNNGLPEPDTSGQIDSSYYPGGGPGEGGGGTWNGWDEGTAHSWYPSGEIAKADVNAAIEGGVLAGIETVAEELLNLNTGNPAIEIPKKCIAGLLICADAGIHSAYAEVWGVSENNCQTGGGGGW